MTRQPLQSIGTVSIFFNFKRTSTCARARACVRVCVIGKFYLDILVKIMYYITLFTCTVMAPEMY